MADIFEAVGADGTHGFIGGVEIDLGEDLFVQGLGLTGDQRAKALALQTVGRVEAELVADGGVKVEVGGYGVDDFAAAVDAVRRAAEDQHDAQAVVGEAALHVGEGDPVVCGGQDEGVVGEAGAVQRFEDTPHAEVGALHAGGVLGEVAAGLGAVGQRSRRADVAVVEGRAQSGEALFGPVFDRVAVGGVVAHREEERSVVMLVKEVDGGVGRSLEMRVLGKGTLVADRRNVGRAGGVVVGQVLGPRQRGGVSGVVQRVDQVVGVVVEPKAAVGQPEHAVDMGVLAREQAGTAGRAGGVGGKGVAEEHALLGERLQRGRRHGVAVRLDITPRVMAVQVEDIKRAGRHCRASSGVTTH